MQLLPLTRRPTAGSWFCLLALASLLELPAVALTRATAAEPAVESAMVVCPKVFRDALQPWLDYRRGQGMQVRVFGAEPTPEALRSSLQEARVPSDRFVLIIGDAPVIGTPTDATREVPVHYRKTTVTAAFGSTPTFPTDAPYGDLDGDGQTELAVGRLPVKTPAQFTSIIERIRAYEGSRDFSAWRGRMQLIGGVGGFGILADTAIESTTRLVLTSSLPPSVRASVLYGSPGHRFYPRKRFTESVIETYQQGCRVWVYAGHGMIDRLDRVPSGPTGIPVLDSKTVQQLQCEPEKAPIAVLLCCYTGAIDAAVDSFAERMVRQPGGPIAVIAGSRVTMPYGNASLTLGMVDAFHGRRSTSDDPKQESVRPAERLGDLFLQALQRLEAKSITETSQVQSLVDTLSTLVSPAGSSLVEERREHASLYGLLGDPLLKLHPPQPVEVTTDAGFDAGAPVRVRINSPIAGRCLVMLDRPLGNVKRSQPGEPVVDPNDLTITSQSMDVKPNETSELSIELSQEHQGLLRIRVHVDGESTWASGGTQTNIRPR
ncbi:MAG: C25 family cysteine peptidase [Planctomycetota bacterium]